MHKVMMAAVAACILAAAQPAFAEEPSSTTATGVCLGAFPYPEYYGQSTGLTNGYHSVRFRYMIVTKEWEGRPTKAEWKRIRELADTALAQVLFQAGPSCSPERVLAINYVAYQAFVDFMGAELPRMKVVNLN